MVVVEGRVEGEKVILPENFSARAGAKVMVVIEQADVVVEEEIDEWDTSSPAYLALISQALAATWDNEEDSIYDEV